MAVIGAGGRKYKNPGDAGFDGIMPATKVVKLTPHDDNDLAQVARGIWSGTNGTINFLDYEGDTVEQFPVFIGYNPIIVTRLLTGGTATNVWAIY